MVKVILQFYPVIRADSEDERAALRPIGRNRDRYHEALEGMNEIVKVADSLGLWGVGSIEHHFWSEGYEVGPSPGILDAYWAATTKNIRVGQLGYVMSTQHPIRVAEETAIIDHLTRGRCFVGFARGYQSRWTNVVGQHLGTRATTSPSAAKIDPAHLFGKNVDKQHTDDDEVNRRIFEEGIDIVVKAWTQESIEHRGTAWQIPFPFDAGVDDWPLGKMGVTGRLGAPGEVDANGVVRRVSVVPAPYSQPYPPVFVATSGSPESVEFAARRGFRPLYFTGLKAGLALGQVYQKAATDAGYSFTLGQNQAVVRIPHIASSRAAAEESVIKYDSDIFRNFYAAMGGHKVERNDVPKAVTKHGLWAIGTADDVRDQLVSEWKQFPAEYVTLIYHYAQMPKDVMIEGLTTFMQKVKPALDELTEYPADIATVAAGGR